MTIGNVLSALCINMLLRTFLSSFSIIYSWQEIGYFITYFLFTPYFLILPQEKSFLYGKYPHILEKILRNNKLVITITGLVFVRMLGK